MGKILIITQARYGSTRLPGKVLMQVEGRSLLEIHLERIKATKLDPIIMVATTEEPESNQIREIAEKLGIKCYAGSMQDVLDRFYQAALPENPEYVVRLTSDCPLIDSSLIDTVVQKAIEGSFDYYSNTQERTFPDGQDVEVFTFSSLQKAWTEATLLSEREHVTPYIWKNGSYQGGNLFKSGNYASTENFGDFRMTVDELRDFEVMKILISSLGTDRSWMEYTQFLKSNHAIRQINADITLNEGYLKAIKNENNN